MKNALLILALCLAGCQCPAPPPTRTVDAPPPPATAPLFVVKNGCNYPIWIQQQGVPASASVVQIAKGGHASYDIPLAGLASTRFWVKTGCDANGNNCAVGQSSPPCPAAGCAPPVDSKIEATWGCDLPEAQCGKTPQGKTLHGPTWWNSSAVDGFTLPYAIEVAPGGGPGCTNVNCNELSLGQCPVTENLSTSGKYPALASVDLLVAGGGGCFSPCMALTAANDGGKGIQPPSDPRAAMYCCPTPPISSPECRGGPVVGTKYVKAIHAMCHSTAYAYAYDDGVGLHTCTATTVLTMTYCPPQPAAK